MDHAGRISIAAAEVREHPDHRAVARDRAAGLAAPDGRKPRSFLRSVHRPGGRELHPDRRSARNLVGPALPRLHRRGERPALPDHHRLLHDSRRAVILAVRPEVRRFSGEFSDGRGHRIVQDSIYDWLQSQGLQDSRLLPAGATGTGVILDNQLQIQGVSGQRSFPNRPDISYVAAGPGGTQRRVNVEIDTTIQGSLNHERTLIRNDPNSMHVFVMVDPVTGQVLSRRIYDPARDRGTRRARLHDASLTLPSPVAQRQPAPGTPPPRLPVQAMRPGEGAVARNLTGARFRPGPQTPPRPLPLLPRMPPTSFQRARQLRRPFRFRRGQLPGQAAPQQAPRPATRQRGSRRSSSSGPPRNSGGFGSL